ncbi:MFS transporter, partial [Lentimicrobium sp. L6]
TITLIVLMLMIPLFGHLTDKIGRKTVLFLSLLGFIIFSYPLFALMFENTFEAILIAMLVFAVFEAMFQAVMPALMTESFPAKVRYTGLSISYNFSLAIFGGTTPLVCTWLVKQSGGDVWMPVYYLMASCVIGVIVALFIPETYKKELE